MKLNKEEILNMNIGELWKQILILTKEEPKILNKKEMEEIKYGINIRIPIQYIIQEWYNLYPQNKTMTIKGYGRHDLLEFLDEVDERETVMRKIIEENIDDEGIITPRIR